MSKPKTFMGRPIVPMSGPSGKLTIGGNVIEFGPWSVQPYIQPESEMETGTKEYPRTSSFDEALQKAQIALGVIKTDVFDSSAPLGKAATDYLINFLGGKS